MGYIEFKQLTKSFKDTQVLKGIDLSIEKGQFVTLLGPSGCGKSTLLRCLAGLEEVTTGKILLDGQDITKTPPQQRGIGMVFQQYSLFPNMNVFNNIAFGLKLMKMDAATIKKKVEKVIELVDLQGKEKAYPTELSGGQQQRVALARAIVNEPKVLLLDEPLSAIDAKLRKELQEKIRRIQQELAITTIFVTHDQDEAMVMSDVIHLLNKGNIEQSGEPVEIYTRPKTKFAAEFIGNYNILTATQMQKAFKEVPFKADYVAIRPETIHLAEKIEDAADEVIVKAKVISHLPHGNVLRYQLEVNDVKINSDVLFRSQLLFEDGQQLFASVARHNLQEIVEKTN